MHNKRSSEVGLIDNFLPGKLCVPEELPTPEAICALHEEGYLSRRRHCKHIDGRLRYSQVILVFVKSKTTSVTRSAAESSSIETVMAGGEPPDVVNRWCGRYTDSPNILQVLLDGKSAVCSFSMA